MAQATWTGVLTFALVSIPVKLVAAAENKNKVEFKQLTPKGNRVAYQRVDAVTGEPVEFSDLLKGYEYARDQYVIIEPDELAALAPAKTSSVTIESFVDEALVDPMYINKPYLLVPDKGGDKPYALLRAALDSTKLAAIGRFVMRSNEYVCVIRAIGQTAMVLETLHWAEEMRDPDEVVGELGATVSDAEVAMAHTIIDTMRDPDFDLSVYSNEYRAQVLALIEAKRAGQPTPAAAPAAEPDEQADLMASLAASVEAAKRRREAKAAGDDA